MAQNNLTGYILIEGGESSVRGIVLITDPKGFPADCHYTEPVRPTKPERILYGSSFDSYAKEELILSSLLDSVEFDPQLWICNDEDILEPLRKSAKIKTVMLEESPHVPLEAAGAVESLPENGVYLIQTEEHGNPLRAEFPANTRQDEVQQTAKMLTENAKTMSILEPFDRMRKLLDLKGAE